jgi:single-strand DNA-binding protein
MADGNTVTLVGTLGADPEVRRTPTGKDVVSFDLVTNERIRAADGSWSDGAPSWFRVTAWNRLGLNAAGSFRKGQRVIVRGVLRVETWKARDGGTGKTVALTAHALGHDLLWGTTAFARNASGTAAEPARTAPADRPADDGWGAPPADDGGGGAAREPVLAQPSWSTAMVEEETPF